MLAGSLRAGMTLTVFFGSDFSSRLQGRGFAWLKWDVPLT